MSTPKILSAVVTLASGRLRRRAPVRSGACLLVPLLVACSAPPRSEIDDSHPAHPAAAEASWSPELADWTSSAFGAVPPSPSAAYACPMHPHRTALTPGRCPECGMDLMESRSDGP